MIGLGVLSWPLLHTILIQNVYDMYYRLSREHTCKEKEGESENT